MLVVRGTVRILSGLDEKVSSRFGRPKWLSTKQEHVPRIETNKSDTLRGTTEPR